MDLVEELIESVVTSLHGSARVQWGEEEISFERPWPRIPFFEAIEKKTGLICINKAGIRFWR